MLGGTYVSSPSYIDQSQMKCGCYFEKSSVISNIYS